MQTETYGARTVTAFFDSRSDADEAIRRIYEAGVERDRVTMVEGDGSTEGLGDERVESKGFFGMLGDLLMPSEDRTTYAEGLRRGGYLVTVRAEAEDYDSVLDILDDEGSIDMEERAEAWRAEGWAGQPVEGVPRQASGASSPDADRDGTIEVVEEDLRIGKRDVSHGRVRVRSYTVEEPVSEDVSLRSERVEIERRPVDRAVGGGEGAFQDRTLELEETTEEAVVSKEARVTEEIDLRKVAENETRTVKDTVRHTEVEVEDERVDASQRGR